MILKNIGLLAGIVPDGVLRKEGAAMGETGMLENAWLRIKDGRIAAFGKMEDERYSTACPWNLSDDEVIDAEGGMVMPAFCDSHTHIVYAGSRAGEFLDKINGLSYEEIAARGGGILNSSDLIGKTSEDGDAGQGHRRSGN